jgi:hypothetical protein
MNIALFADVHGRMLLALKLCARWQRETGERIDLILQAGDMGIFPARDRLDKATLRHAEREPTELGFMQDFVARTDDPHVTETLAQLTCDLIFVRGNHEDHAWLDDLERQARGPTFPVDVYQRLWCLKSGEPFSFTGADGATINVLGIGRIGPTTDRPSQLKDIYVQPYEEQKLRHMVGMPFDVLLTHDAPPVLPRGIPIMREILEHAPPAYHFYGHIGGPCHEGIDANGTTHFCKLADLEWDGSGKVAKAGAMALLRWNDRTHRQLEVIDTPWYREYTAHTWRYF